MGVQETHPLPHPIQQAIYFSRVIPMSLGSESRAGMVWNGNCFVGQQLEWGGGEERKRFSYPVTRAYTQQILIFSYLSLVDEPIRGSHFSSFLHILPLKQYNGLYGEAVYFFLADDDLQQRE